MSKSLTELAAEIVTAQLAHTQMSKDQVKGSLREVFEVLSNLQDTEEHVPSTNDRKQVAAPVVPSVVETPSKAAEQPEPAQAPSTNSEKPAVRTKTEPPARATTAPSARDSVQEDKVICLECGAEFKQLTHLHLQRHGLTVDEYKHKHGLPKRQPLIAKALSETKRRKAKELGLGEKLQKAKQKRA